MSLLSVRTILASALITASCFISFQAVAGGIVLGGTRIIYGIDQKQASISVKNSSDSSRYMVQSWIEDANEKKSNDFIVTPPLYVSNPGTENSLRLMYAGPELRKDRETLFYLTANAIPSVDRDANKGKNVLLLSAATKIKVFVRPTGLLPEIEKAPEMLSFARSGTQVMVSNPTPYYITMVGIKVGGKALESVMVAPKDSATFKIPAGKFNEISYRTMNDYGGMTKELMKKLN